MSKKQNQKHEKTQDNRKLIQILYLCFVRIIEFVFSMISLPFCIIKNTIGIIQMNDEETKKYHPTIRIIKMMLCFLFDIMILTCLLIFIKYTVTLITQIILAIQSPSLGNICDVLLSILFSVFALCFSAVFYSASKEIEIIENNNKNNSYIIALFSGIMAFVAFILSLISAMQS